MEKICFELENISVTYLDKEVIRIDRLAIHQFDRIGIVGNNGAGKSTILKLLTGIIKPTTGQVKSYVDYGYFEQIEGPSNMEADPALLGKLAVPNFSDSLSGGEQTRLKLAQLFTNYHEALLLDEPTTHLDQEGITFLMDELKYYYGALVLISHDRAVLDELVTTIIEVHEGEVRVYKGNYSQYQEQKSLELDQQRLAHEQYQKEKSRLENAAKEKMKKAEKVAQAGKMSKREAKSKPNRMYETKSKGTSQKAVHRAAKAIEQRKEKLVAVEPVRENRPIVFRQSSILELHNRFPIIANQLSLKVDENLLLDEVSFQISLGSTVAISGKNGCGKSSLLNYIVNHGEGLAISPKAKIGYFNQLSYHDLTDDTLLQFLKNRSEYDESFLRSVLHSMQFSGTDIVKNVKSLSGGERIRLELCQLFLGNYNILLLDEPTNFLDIHALESLESFIKGYQGTILLVSHDQMFLKNVADCHYKIEEQQFIQIGLTS